MAKAKTENDREYFVVELKNETCSPVYFPPLQRMLRSEFSPNEIRLRDAASHERMGQVPGIIPGQRVELVIPVDQDPLGPGRVPGQGRILEPLHLAEHASLKEWIGRLPAKLESQAELANIDAGTWLFWIARLVEDGTAKPLASSIEIPRSKDVKDRFGEPLYSGHGEDPSKVKRRELADRLLEALLEKIGGLGEALA
ncbi:hypothetical protein AB1K70_17000 [Bremerella sp. JC770]|uniref:hypothetical protein n=1 Tax=Bremerella sp. JC770 TaxID=3232137 RepID=UPI003458D806